MTINLIRPNIYNKTIQPADSGSGVSEKNGYLPTDGSEQSSFSDILKTAMSSNGTEDLESIFERASQTYQIPSALLKAVAKAESNFNPLAVSSAGAQGIMQLMPATAQSLGVTNSFDPEQNIMGGAKYLSQMLQRYDGDTTLALAAYNAGPGNVRKYNGIPPFEETHRYIDKVMAYAGDGVTAAVTGGNSELQNHGVPDLSQQDLNLLMSLYRYRIQWNALIDPDSDDTEQSNIASLGQLMNAVYPKTEV